VQFVRTSGLLGDIVFPHSGATGPESKMMRVFCQVRQVAVSGPKLLSMIAVL